MAAQFARPYHHVRPNGPSQSAPNAALLIDFDNVTMGIRSDLSKELKNLLNSDIIKGKVAVQRAYADWRRYPQYVVSLAESSVDLIFAPAYGSAKKNATDIRLAIDALELVFTRPEIGTFILLSGDSDFSSLVLKLKEYGKYVIGVGIRESASDILVQNCDEYYSYSSLSGLTRASDEERERLDPWELVEKAVRQMASRRDVMRSDRLKQVMLEIDGNFNEKELGYSKFSRFLSDAAARNKLRLKKGENGQLEVSPPDVEPAVEVSAAEARPEPQLRREEPRGRRGGRGRDHDRGHAERAARDQREERTASTSVVEPAPAVAVEPVVPAAVVAEVQPLVEPAESKQRPAAVAQEAGDARGDLRASYDLLRRAVEYLIGKNGEMVRDSDVKRRMLELQPGWDESSLGFSKFSRFLRQAHDAEVIDLHRGEGGTYQLTLSTSRSRKHVELSRPAGRGQEKASGKSARPAEKAAVQEKQPAAVATVAVEAESSVGAAEAPAAPVSKPAAEKEQPVATVSAAPAPAASEPRTAPVAPRGIGIGARLGTRGRTLQAPPPVLPGQAVVIPGLTTSKSQGESPATEEKKEAAAAATSSSETAPTRASAPKKSRARSTARGEGRAAPAQKIAERYGLPTEAKEVEAYILGRYKGVGPKTIAALFDAFGAGELFDVLETQPDRVREVLGGSRRAELVLAAWKSDIEQRRAAEGAAEEPAATEASAEAPQPAEKPAARRQGARRGTRKTRQAAANTTAKVEAESKPARRSGGRAGKAKAEASPAEASVAADGAQKGATPEAAKKPAQRRGRRGSRTKTSEGE